MDKQYSIGSNSSWALEPDCLDSHPSSTAYWLNYAGQLLWASMRITVRTKLHVKLMAPCLEHKKYSVYGRYHSYYITCDVKKSLNWVTTLMII